MIKAIFFDMDGTILNTLTDISNSVNYALKTFNYPEQKEENVRLMLGNGARNLIKSAVPKDLTDKEIDEVFKVYQNYYDSHSNVFTKPYNGILDLLKKLKDKGYLLAVVSNKFQHLVNKLNEEKFESLFDLSIGEQKGIKIKPAPDMIINGLNFLNIKNEEAIYIGDSEVDIETAKNAKLISIAVTWGFRNIETLNKYSPDYIVNSTEEILTIIEGMKHD